MSNLRKILTFLTSINFFLFVVPFSSIAKAEENKIEDIHIDVELHEDGSATVRENRKTEMHEDTELYIEMKNLQDSDLLDFEVDGFTEEPDWDVDASFEEKAYHYGVLEVDDGYELVWGISDYGEEEYDLSYSLSNLVRNLEDGQALFWNFDTFLSHPTDRMTMEVSAPFAFDEELLDYYGFGFEGVIEIDDGVLEWTGYGLDDSNDITVLLQFPEDTFAATTSVDMTLEEQKDEATAGSSYNEDPPTPGWVIGILATFITITVGIISTFLLYAFRRSHLKREYNDFKPLEIIKENKTKHSQHPPALEADLGRYSALISKLTYSGGGFSEFFLAYILIWSLEDKVKIEAKEEERFIFGSKTNAYLSIENFEEEFETNLLAFDEYVDLFEMGESTFEEVVWGMLLEVADENGVVTSEELSHWSKENVESVTNLVEAMEEVSLTWLDENGYLDRLEIRDWGFPLKIEQLTDKGRDLADDIVQFDNFIQNIDEISLEHFDNWQELIIWAAIFGRGEKTIEYLEEFQPETWAYLEATYPYVYGHYYGYQHIYTSSSRGLASGGYSASGGAGMSSAGGGAGAGGGGGGGSR